MSIRAGQYVAARLGRLAKRQAQHLKPREGGPILPDEQLRRFQEGEELWRLEAGLVSPEQYERYEAEMIRRMEDAQL